MPQKPSTGLAALEAIATRMELTLNRDKTCVTRVTDGSISSVSTVLKRKSPSSGKNTIYIFPAKSAQQKIRNRLKYITSRRAPDQSKEFVEMVNPIVTGGRTTSDHERQPSLPRLQRFVNIRFRRVLDPEK